MVHRKRSKIPPTSSTVSSITSLRRVSTTTKPCLQNWKLETNNANYVDSNRSQTKWVIPLSRPPLNLQFLERGRLRILPLVRGRRERRGRSHTAPRLPRFTEV